MSRQLSGLRAWLVQRLSAAYLALFIPSAILLLIFNPLNEQDAWRAFVARTEVSIAIALCGLALLVHAWVGVRDVLLDYLRPPTLRLTALALLWGWLLIMALWLVRILARVAG